MPVLQCLTDLIGGTGLVRKRVTNWGIGHLRNTKGPLAGEPPANGPTLVVLSCGLVVFRWVGRRRQLLRHDRVHGDFEPIDEGVFVIQHLQVEVF